jgi:very-short-patch-repair endonuclease
MRDSNLFLNRAESRRALVLETRARQMRHRPTESEARLFEALRAGKLGVRFQRQVPVAGRFIADLVAPEVRLIVEVDGGCHERRRHADMRRDRVLVRAGYRVLRLEAGLVMRDLVAAVAQVRAAVEALRRARDD